eukprot:308611-Amphidinium_carterae.1
MDIQHKPDARAVLTLGKETPSAVMHVLHGRGKISCKQAEELQGFPVGQSFVAAGEMGPTV